MGAAISICILLLLLLLLLMQPNVPCKSLLLNELTVGQGLTKPNADAKVKRGCVRCRVRPTVRP